MSTSTLDLWPSQFAPAMITPPLALLRSQASLLAAKTNGLVEAYVLSRKRGADFLHQFYLRAPALDNEERSIRRARRTADITQGRLGTADRPLLD